jgi:hypothetical protein
MGRRVNRCARLPSATPSGSVIFGVSRSGGCALSRLPPATFRDPFGVRGDGATFAGPGGGPLHGSGSVGACWQIALGVRQKNSLTPGLRSDVLATEGQPVADHERQIDEGQLVRNHPQLLEDFGKLISE